MLLTKELQEEMRKKITVDAFRIMEMSTKRVDRMPLLGEMHDPAYGQSTIKDHVYLEVVDMHLLELSMATTMEFLSYRILVKIGVLFQPEAMLPQVLLPSKEDREFCAKLCNELNLISICTTLSVPLMRAMGLDVKVVPQTGAEEVEA